MAKHLQQNETFPTKLNFPRKNQTFSTKQNIPKKLNTSPENKDLAPGSGEFMVAWLTLIKKLIDVKQVTESSHSLPSQTVPPSAQYKQFEFEPVHFLAKSHKVNCQNHFFLILENSFTTLELKPEYHILRFFLQFAFEVISQLWDELYAYSGMKTLKNEIGPLTEHVIVILKHLLKGQLKSKIIPQLSRLKDGSSENPVRF